jgi:hypothetical protein
MVYGLFRALPGDRAFLSPSPLRSLLLKNLTPASRRQDHTTSPSASRAIRQRHISVHRIPPHVRDDRETPLRVGRDGEGYKADLAFRKTRIFLQKGLDRQISDLPVGSTSVARMERSAIRERAIQSENGPDFLSRAEVPYSAAVGFAPEP